MLQVQFSVLTEQVSLFSSEVINHINVYEEYKDYEVRIKTDSDKYTILQVQIMDIDKFIHARMFVQTCETIARNIKVKCDVVSFYF